MLRLKFLVCCGCQALAEDNVFYDNEKKHPIYLECGHSLCPECIDRHPICPICNKQVRQTENFTARAIFESTRSQPITVFKNWYYAKMDEPETCSGCFETTRRLRMCITCELSLNNLSVQKIRDDGRPWHDFGQVAEAEKLMEEPPRNTKWPDLGRHSLRPRFRAMFHVLANRVFCSDCILNNHEGHVVKTLQDLEYYETDLKSITSGIVSKFLWDELKEKKGNCLLKTMKMLRTCEKLVHHVLVCFPDPTKAAQGREFHDSKPSKVNKFFGSLSFHDSNLVPPDEGDRLIISLEEDLEFLPYSGHCNCGDVWDELHRLHFGNQIEKKFVEKINGLGDMVVIECPLASVEIESLMDKVNEMSKQKLSSIYTVFCWSHNKICMFDNRDRKPLTCPHCNVSTCMDCVGSGPTVRCSFCNGLFFEYDYKVDTAALELIKFYKTNCVELIEKWWTCDASELGFCFSCSSYSDQLEVCVYCELHRQNMNPALKSTSVPGNTILDLQESLFFFNYKGLTTFPMRWQCADCKRRLEANWMHRNCKDFKSVIWKGAWNRGCNHLRSRTSEQRKCCSCDTRADRCEYNSISLRSLKNYGPAMKVATMDLIQSVLKAGIEEIVQCKLWKIRMLNIYGILNGQTRHYFKSILTGTITGEMETYAHKISFLIDHLKHEWCSYISGENVDDSCKCTKVWNDADHKLKTKLKEIASFHLNEIVDKCPLEMEHGIEWEMDKPSPDKAI